MRDLGLLLVLLPLLPITFRFPQVGVLLWAWTAILAPNQYLYGFLSDVPFNKIIAVVAIAVMIFSRGRKDFRLDRTLLLMVGLLLVGTVSAYTSIADDSLNWDIYSKLTKILVFAYLITVVMRTRIRLHALVCTLGLALGFSGVAEGLMYIASGGSHKILGSSSFGDNNGLALALVMIIPLLYYLFRYSAAPLIKFSWMAGLVLSVVTIIGTSSRGAFVGMAVLAVLFVLNSRRKTAGLAAIGIAVLLVFALAPSAWFDRIDTIADAGEDSSFMGRVVAWKISLLVALDHPVFGGGFHAIQNWPVWNAYRNVFYRLDFIPTPPPEDLARAAHSVYFEILGDLGFLGLFIFLALIFVGFLNTRAVRRMAKHKVELAWAYDLATMLQFSLITYCVSGAALSVGYLELLYIQIAITARLRGILLTSQVPEAGRLPWAATARSADLQPVR